MEAAVRELLTDAGIRIIPTARSYRPEVSLPNAETKVLKPQNIVEMLAKGTRDVGFAGEDWVREMGVDLVEILDTRLDPVQVVAAGPAERFADGIPRDRALVVASEYQRLACRWVQQKSLQGSFLRSYGATEVLPPEDADIIIDNTATGNTLRANGLIVLDTLMESSTRLYANPAAMEGSTKRERIEDLRLLLASVLDARLRVMIEVNAPKNGLDAIVAILPCMREATVAPLFGNGGFAVKAAVPRDELASIIPAVKAAGATDVVVTTPSQIVP
jgi:ATP phosphoribosyltransferase